MIIRNRLLIRSSYTKGGLNVYLHRRLSKETAADLARGMHYPDRWDPFFKNYMTLADIYRYPTQHYDFHRSQLTIRRDRGSQ